MTPTNTQPQHKTPEELSTECRQQFEREMDKTMLVHFLYNHLMGLFDGQRGAATLISGIFLSREQLEARVLELVGTHRAEWLGHWIQQDEDDRAQSLAAMSLSDTKPAPKPTPFAGRLASLDCTTLLRLAAVVSEHPSDEFMVAGIDFASDRHPAEVPA